VRHVLAGYRQRTVARFLGVHPSVVCRWMKACRRGGDGALAGRDSGGRPRKLSRGRERQVLGWFRRSPKSFGFPTELWTAARVARVIDRKWQITFHPRYLNPWLAERRISSATCWRTFEARSTIKPSQTFTPTATKHSQASVVRRTFYEHVGWFAVRILGGALHRTGWAVFPSPVRCQEQRRGCTSRVANPQLKQLRPLS
jgi:transposase